MSAGDEQITQLLEQFQIDDSNKETFDKLKELDTVYTDAVEALKKEINLLEAKFRKSVAPTIKERDDLIQEKNIPNFWLKALLENNFLREMIKPEDIPILKHLTNIRIEYPEDANDQSFTLFFTFSENEYFTNTELKKEYKIAETDGVSDFHSTTSSTIEWKELSKNVTKKSITNVQRNKRTGETRTNTKVVESESFFLFFRSHTIPTEESLAELGMEEVEKMQETIGMDFEAGRKLKDYIVPRAVSWFLGEGEDSDDEDMGDYDEDGEDDEDEDGEDEEEGEEGEDGKAKPECKQQ